jgi:DinB family protein
LRRLVHEAGSDIVAHPEPGEWSVMECVDHLVDAEIVMSGRYRFVLVQDEPPLVGYDQDLWVKLLHGDDDFEQLLDVFDTLRLANVTLWARTPMERRQRVGIHQERGPESYDLSFRMIAGHDRLHISQAERALQAVRGL